MVIYFLRFCGDPAPLLPLLSEERRKRALGMRSEKRRAETVFSYLLLRHALLENYGIKEPPEFVYGEYGKPFLKDLPDIFFSISHAGGAAACAVSKEPVGADIQDIRHMKPETARKFCTPEEFEEISAASRPDREICRLWSVKESYGKLTGRGFSEGFGSIDASALINSGRAAVIERDSFFISVCADTRVGTPRLTEVNEAELACKLTGG